MLPRWQTLALVGFLVALLGVLCAAEPAEEGYAPVAPAPAVHAALRSNLKVVRDWLDQKDLQSAAQAAQDTAALSHLFIAQGSKAGWRSNATALAEASTRLAATARNNDADGCAKLTDECSRLLDVLAKEPPGKPAVDKAFKPQGASRVWMRLLDGAYVDAKSAKDGPELEQLAYALAEELNALQYVRADARWRQYSRDARAAALEVVEKARGKDLAAAKTALKTVYQRCEACHNTTRPR
jgi:hypothetical protein